MHREKRIRVKTLQIVIHSLYRSQNSSHEENSPDLRTDDNRWVQDLENTGCNKIIAPCTLYTKKGIFYFCNRSNRLIYMYAR